MTEKTNETSNKSYWREQFDERQRKEIAFAELYAKQFAHGTTGHNALMVIAKMATMLDAKENT